MRVRPSDVRIGVRLAAVVTLLLVMLAAVAAVGMSAVAAQSAAAQELAKDRTTTRLAMQVKFRSADFNGWQTAYAFDIVRGLAGATADDAAARVAFLASAQAFREELAQFGTANITDAERAILAEIGTRFDKFVALDAEVVAGYRAGTADQIGHASELVAGDEIAIFNAIAAAVDEVVGSVESDAVAAQARTEAASRSAHNTILGVGIAAILLGALLAWVLIRSITRPLGVLVQRLDAIATGDGDLTQRADADRKDEIGLAARGFNTFAERMRQLVADVAGSALRVSQSARELSAVSEQLASGAEESSAQAGVVSASAGEVSSIVATMATSAVEMNASIAEIAQSASRAMHIAGNGVLAAQEANVTVGKLGESSTEIESVVKLITSIAEQTNLLALNATIEAARAGEAGRGFAVVAGEVKGLAQQTAAATGDIASRIEAIRFGSDEAIQVIGRIGEVVAQINDTQTAIAAAIEQQTATTNEMSRNVSDTAIGASEIASNIQGVAQAAQDTSAGAITTRETAEELGRAATALQELVGSFRY